MGALEGKTVVIIHGWSDDWESMKKVGLPLKAEGAEVHYANYDSREDKAVFEDFAEGLQQELTKNKNGKKILNGGERSLHFVTHSTGALVLRQWFKQYPHNQAKVGNVVFLAPPNFGSPLAKLGNSLIGKLFKGHHWADEDRFEAGKNILHGLELASPYSWKLAEYDLLGPNGSIYSKDKIRASVITGHKRYGGFRRFVNKPGTDGTIVVAGANLNVRYLQLDFSGENGLPTSRWHGFDVHEEPKKGVTSPDLPFSIHKKLTHASILELEKNKTLRNQVIRCLKATPDEYEDIREDFSEFTVRQISNDPGDKLHYQQILFRVVDERNMRVPDYHLEFNVWEADRLTSVKDGPRHVRSGEIMTDSAQKLSGKLDEVLERNLHTHSQDPAYKRYLISPKELKKIVGNKFVLTMRINAKSGDRDIKYLTCVKYQDSETDNFLFYDPKLRVNIHPFDPNKTTLIQIRINRESTLVKVGQKKEDF